MKGKIFTVDVFHYEKKHAFSTFAEVGDIDNVRMADRSSGACLSFEARDSFTFLKVLVVEDVRPHSFYRDATRDQVLIAREINLAHRAAAESFFEQVS